MLDILEHPGLQIPEGWFGNATPDVVAKEEKLIPVAAGLGHVKVASDKRH